MAEISVKANVLNLPVLIREGFMIARQDNGELWYYGTSRSEEDAHLIAKSIGNGVVLKVEKEIGNENKRNHHR